MRFVEIASFSAASALMSALPAGCLMMDEEGIRALAAQIPTIAASLTPEAMMAAKDEMSEPMKYTVRDDGAGIIHIKGTMTKHPHWLQKYFGGASYTGIIDAINRMGEDKSVKDAWVHIESHGGEVAGGFDAAQAIRELDKKKPVYGYIADHGMSGGYLLPSQGRRVFTNSNADLGSIGVFTTMVDTSKLAADAGVKVHVIKAGRHKAAGVPGTEITDEQLGQMQGRMDDLHRLFIRTALGAKGRALSPEQAARVSDASVHIGRSAVKVGLADNIASFDDAVKMARDGRGNSPQRKVYDMSQGRTGAKPPTPGPAVVTTPPAATVSDMTDEELDAMAAGTTPAVVAATPATDEQIPAQPQITCPTGMTPAQATEILFAAQANNITGTADIANMRTMAGYGENYISNLRSATIKMGAAAGLGDVSGFIASVPPEQLGGIIQNYRTQAQGRGTFGDGSRASIPATTGVVPPVAPAAPAAPHVAGQPAPAGSVAAPVAAAAVTDPTPEQMIEDTRAGLRAAGVYSVI